VAESVASKEDRETTLKEDSSLKKVPTDASLIDPTERKEETIVEAKNESEEYQMENNSEPPMNDPELLNCNPEPLTTNNPESSIKNIQDIQFKIEDKEIVKSSPLIDSKSK
jgi:hypothetical protein